MSDVLAITVPIIGRYASVNHTNAGSHRAGKKSAAYHDLFDAVKRAAESEMARTGWETALCECFATIIRYVPDRRRHDSMNLAKCEWDSLTAAGVWLDDSLANPCLPMIRYNAPHRVTIVVVKLYESVLQPASQTESAKSPQSASRPRKAAQAGNDAPVKPALVDVLDWKPGDPIPPGCALLNGQLISRERALALAGAK